MAMLLFKGEALTVRATHNVISEFTRLNDVPFMEVMRMSSKDPMGWVRDMVYCSLRVYNPNLLIKDKENGSSELMSKYEVGEEIFSMKTEEITEVMKELLTDFVTILNGDNSTKKVASEKK